MKDDTISRQQAIDVIDKIFPADPMRNDYTQGITCGAALAMEYIKQLPSAQQETHDKHTETHACDLISRQAAIEDIRTMIPKDARFDIKWIEMWLMQLPSAQPEIIRCKGCKHKHLENAVWTCPFGLPGGPDFYCGYGAERRSDGN